MTSALEITLYLRSLRQPRAILAIRDPRSNVRPKLNIFEKNTELIRFRDLLLHVLQASYNEPNCPWARASVNASGFSQACPTIIDKISWNIEE